MPTVQEVLTQGWQLHQAGRLEEAERVYRGVLAQVPHSPEALVYLGIVQFDRRQFEASVTSYREALRLSDRFPVAWNNLGNSLRMLGEIDEAESCFAKALDQQPGYLSALINRGTLWVWSGEIERGLHWYREGLKVAPDHAELHRNLGVIYLLLGRYEEGWPEYRWRHRMPGMPPPPVTVPRWQGQPLEGRTILLYPEQGRGDAIQFLRLAPLLRGAGARCIVQAPPAMIPLFSTAPGIDLLLPEGAAVPAVDYHASLIDAADGWYQATGELPHAEQLFGDHGGYLSVSDTLAAYWQRWLSASTGGRRIGINWQGNRQHHADVYRSVPLAALRPLAEIPGLTLISLQFGAGSEQLTECEFADSVVRLPERLDSSGGAFTDTAAVLRGLDAVITSDTALAHLAGALGVDVTLMLGKVPDWRWGLEGDATPWYPTMSLVRQSRLGDWGEVVERIVGKLQQEEMRR